MRNADLLIPRILLLLRRLLHEIVRQLAFRIPHSESACPLEIWLHKPDAF
jgi:hypothetical protein